MAVNKVVINDTTVLDLTGDTVTPSDLVEGVTAHDATGMQITGTRPATSGTDTSDATATASDIAKGKTAYVQGAKVTGTVDTYTDGETCYWACFEVTSDNTSYIYYYLDPGKNGMLIKNGARVRAQAMLSNFGDATAADVTSGKTFTSKAGLKLTGTNTNDADTGDATATAADIAKGKTAYVQGAKVTGTVDTYTDGETCYWACFEVTSDNTSYIYYYLDPGKNGMLIKNGARVRAQAMLSNFGDATAADVTSGKTFTSKAGLKLTGTNTNDADTGDATATAADIAKGKTAYVQGAKVTGKLTEYLAGETLSYYTSGDGEITIKRDSDSDNISIKIHCFDDDKIMRHNSYIKLGADAILFGNATAADVAKGKTFTSAAGVNVTGTAEPAESNNNVEAYAVTTINPSVSFKRTDGAIKIWGYGTMTSSGGWGQQTTSLVAFEGDKYHKGAIYGSPSSTSLSLSISNGKLTGLPSGLTAISAIVTRGI